MRFLPANAGALLVELADLRQTLALFGSLQEEPVAGVLEVVPAARTVLVRYDAHRVGEGALVAQLARRRLDRHVEREGRLVQIEVDYDGEDLREVAQILGIPPREVVRRHTAAEYTVAFTGFAPGFAYLSTEAPGLDVPRRKTPRTRVPAGSVALAGGFSAVYPQDSPGGWQLIGRTRTPMWDIGRTPPALLQPGFRVRFVEAGRTRSVQVPGRQVAGGSQEAERTPGAALVVRATGVQALLQDLGREGQAAQGVSVSGALDRASLRAATRLVGNAPGAVAIEIAGGGFEVESLGDTVAAVTGADGPLTLLTREGRQWPLARWQPFALAAGDRLRVGPPASGLRSYLAVRGGFAVAPVLGSASTDTLARVGPPPLAAGTTLALAQAPHAPVGLPEEPPCAWPVAGAVVELDVVMGPRTDWFTPEAVALFARQEWTVTPQSNRVGLRLAGDTPLARAAPGELPSEGTLPGSIQVPAGGQPVLFLADHPLTGGYPVIGAVAPHHRDLLGQIPIGAKLRFRPLRPFQAIADTASPP